MLFDYFFVIMEIYFILVKDFFVWRLEVFIMLMDVGISIVCICDFSVIEIILWVLDWSIF